MPTQKAAQQKASKAATASAGKPGSPKKESPGNTKRMQAEGNKLNPGHATK